MTTIDLISTYYNTSNPIFQLNFTKCVKTLSFEAYQNSELESNFSDYLWNSTEISQRCLRLLLPVQLYSRPFILPMWQQIIWSTLFALMITIAALGNSIVIWIVLAHRRMRTVTNYFLFNLAMADVTMSVLNTIFNFVYVLDSNWTFGTTYCTVNNFVSYATVASSVFSIAAMSSDRYFAIVYPLSPRMPKRRALFLITAIWASSFLLALPSLLYSTTATYRYADGSLRTLCFLDWPDGQSGSSHSDFLYNIVFLVLTYILPMLCMSYTYFYMCRVLWGSQSIGVVTARQKESIKSKQRVVRMLITVVLIFVSCWLPYHIYFLYSYHNPQVNHTDYIHHVFLTIYLLAMSNSMVNPIIYYTMNSRFRGYFRSVLCFCRPRAASRLPPNDHRWLKNGRTRKSWTSNHTSLRFTLSSSFIGRQHPVGESNRKYDIVDSHRKCDEISCQAV